MQRIHFTVEDLARSRMTATLGPVAESVFALDLFGRSGAGVNGWRSHVRRRLGRGANAIEQLTRAYRPLPDLLCLLNRGKVTGDGREDYVRQQATGAVLEFCKAAVTPQWSQVRSHLEAERDVRGRIMITHGVDRLLSTLHARLNWTPPVLEIASDQESDVYLGGRGLLLCPSLFLFSKLCVVIESERRTGLPTLVYPAPTNPGAFSSLSNFDENDEQALGALIGRTRAAALQALTDCCTTSELAQRLGISAAAASQHATILRKAGLITTFRNRNTVWHSVTSLGVALLQKDPAG
jgi:DNA-binding transcriptional ArsR family regulator